MAEQIRRTSASRTSPRSFSRVRCQRAMRISRSSSARAAPIFFWPSSSSSTCGARIEAGTESS